MTKEKAIALGNKVKDRVSGFTGIATSKHTEFSGMVQYGIQPAVEAKKLTEHPDAMSFDAVQVQYVGEGLAAIAKPTNVTLPFELGEEVEDRLTGIKGIAKRRNDWMNGCVSISIQQKGEPGKEPPKSHQANYTVVRRVGPGIREETPKHAARRPGGAPQIVERP
jgi:hypothetical protein